MKSCKNNANFFWCNLKNNLRLDGRNFEDSRNISFYFLGDYGNVEVSIGFTKVICRITSEIVKPFDKKPNEGIIKINLDIDSFTSVNDNLKINDECLEIRNLIERILKSSSILNFESLCIIPHKKVWCLLINIIVIENDGNLFDACYLSAYSALVHFRNNEVKVENSEIIIDQDESNYSPLSIHNSPILTTFAYFNSEDICLIDPSLHEEEFMSSKLSVALNKNGQLISILKPGGSPISYLKILEAIELAKKRVTCILKILEDALEEDKKLRDDLKKKNFHIKYSCNPVSIKYNDSYEKSMNIPVNQSLRNNWNIEKIIKKYEQYIKLQDMEQEENLVSSIEETNNNENTKYNKQYILNEELRKIKNENKIKHENYLYVDNYNDYMSNIKDNNFLEEPFKNKNILDNLDIGKIKRQEFGDNNSYLHNNKFLKTNDIQKKEIMNFSNTITKNIKEKKNINKENKTESMTTNKEYSSDIDFSIAINENEDYNDTYNSINKDKNLSEEYEKNNLIKNDKDFIDQIKKNMNPNDEVTYKYVEDMELKKINIRGVDIEYRIYNLEEGIYIVDEENYEKIKKLWNEEELKKAKENFEESFDIKNQGIKDNEWIMFPLDYEENKNIKLIKADFDNPTYDYILTYYDKERDYYWKYKRRNFYKMFRNTIHEKPPYKSELEKDKRFYGKEIIIPKKELDNKIFRQPMLSDVLTDGYSKEPIGLESWRFVKYPYGNLIEHQKYSQLYCVKKNNNDKPDMRYYYLGNSNLAVSEICIGTMNFGNYVNEKLAHELFDYAYEEFQVNFFDTAEIYPLPVNENLYGLSEEILGNWLESKGKANRHKFVISTKICGRTNKIPWLKKYKTKKLEEKKREEEIKKKSEQSLLSSNGENNFNSNGPEKLYKLKKKEELYLKKDYEMINKLEEIEKYNDDNNLITLTKENIISSVDDSLKRLKTNYIDLLQLHWPDRYYPNQSSGDYSDVLFDYNKYYDDFVPFIEQLQAIDELKKKGKIREWGLSNETPFGLLKFYELCKNLHISPPVSIQLEYNLLCRNDVEKGFLEISRPQNTNISILAYSPLCAGILTGKYLEYTDYTTKGRMQKFPSYMKRLRGSLATYIIRELYYLSQKYYFPNLTVAALKWVYTRSFITSTIIGISDFLQLRENLYSLTDNFLFTDKLEREINALHWKFRDPIRIIQ